MNHVLKILEDEKEQLEEIIEYSLKIKKPVLVREELGQVKLAIDILRKI